MPVPNIVDPLKAQTVNSLVMKKQANDPISGPFQDLSLTNTGSFSEDDSNPLAAVISREEEDSSVEDTVVANIGKTEHKIAEENGFHVEEPLLKENPNRFVLFPIQGKPSRPRNAESILF